MEWIDASLAYVETWINLGRLEMLVVHDMTLLGRMGVLHKDVARGERMVLQHHYRRRYRSGLKVLPTIYGIGGTMGS